MCGHKKGRGNWKTRRWRKGEAKQKEYSIYPGREKKILGTFNWEDQRYIPTARDRGTQKARDGSQRCTETLKGGILLEAALTIRFGGKRKKKIKGPLTELALLPECSIS